MIRRFFLTLAIVLLASPVAAWAQAPAGMQLRVDRSTSAADPDDVPDVKIAAVAQGIQVNTGPAAVVYNAANVARGNYMLSGSFTLLAPSDHVNYYGLVFGGSNLQGATQNYLYFLVAQNGTFIIKRRVDDATTEDVQGRTSHAVVVQPDANGRSVNRLEVRVASDKVDYVVNGTVVHTTPRSGLTANTDGIYGVRVNHRIPGVVVEGLTVHQH